METRPYLATSMKAKKAQTIQDIFQMACIRLKTFKSINMQI